MGPGRRGKCVKRAVTHPSFVGELEGIRSVWMHSNSHFKNVTLDCGDTCVFESM